MRSIVAATALLALAGCSTIIQGTDQKILVQSTPRGAQCILTRSGKRIAVIDVTPITITVRRAKDDIFVRCSLPGYLPGIERLHSGVAKTTKGNALLGPVGGAVGATAGLLIDSADGAINEYPHIVTVELLLE